MFENVHNKMLGEIGIVLLTWKEERMLHWAEEEKHAIIYELVCETNGWLNDNFLNLLWLNDNFLNL